MNRDRVVAVVAFVLIAGQPGTLLAQGAASWQIPPDVRAEGMGRAHSMLDLGPFAAWANPGALGLVRGLEFAAMQTQLVPDLAEDVDYSYYSIVGGFPPQAALADLSLSVGFNRTYLDYGVSPWSPGVTFSSHEESFGGVLALGYRDLLGVGVGVKTINADLFPAWLGGSIGSGTGMSYGLFVQSHALPAWKQSTIRIMGALSWLNRGDDIFLVVGGFGDELPKTFNTSIGFEFRHGGREGMDPKSPLYPLLGDSPLLGVSGSIGLVKDLTSWGAVPDTSRLSFAEEHQLTYQGGLEAVALGLVAARWGYVYDDVGEIKESTWGLGIQFQNTVGFDMASIPQFRGLQRVEKYSVWIKLGWDRLGGRGRGR
jgi:hypothetical protein